MLGEHSLPGGGRPEPVAVATAIQAVLAALVTIGWLHLDDAAISTVATIGGGIIALVVALTTRSKVTPVDDPRDTDGAALAPTGDDALPVSALLARHRSPGSFRARPPAR